MPLMASLIALASAVESSDHVMLDALVTTFEKVCVAPATMAAQREAANGLSGVTSERISGYDKNREPLVPGVRYSTPGLQIGVFGYTTSGLCWVAGDIEPDMKVDAFVEAVGTHFGKKPRKEISTNDFYRGGWVKDKRQFDIEWQRKDGHILGILSVRKRDGYSG